VRALGFEEEIEKVAPEAFFNYLKDDWDAVNSLIGDLIFNIKAAIADADGDMRAKADALVSLGALREALVVAASHIRDLNMYVDHDTSELSDLFVKVAKGLLVLYRYLKAGWPLREIEADLSDLTLDVSIFIGDTVRHTVEKAGGPKEAQVSAAAQGSA
jgi:hypothetical protein